MHKERYFHPAGFRGDKIDGEEDALYPVPYTRITGPTFPREPVTSRRVSWCRFVKSANTRRTHLLDALFAKRTPFTSLITHWRTRARIRTAKRINSRRDDYGKLVGTYAGCDPSRSSPLIDSSARRCPIDTYTW